MDDVLTADDVEQFMTKGYVEVRGCFTRAAGGEYTDTSGPGSGTRRTIRRPGPCRDPHGVAPRHRRPPRSRRRRGGRCATSSAARSGSRPDSRTVERRRSSSTCGRAPTSRGRPAPAGLARLAQGRRLLPALPRLARAGPADPRALVRRACTRAARRSSRPTRSARSRASSPRIPRACCPPGVDDARCSRTPTWSRSATSSSRRPARSATSTCCTRSCCTPSRRTRCAGRGSSPTRR